MFVFVKVVRFGREERNRESHQRTGAGLHRRPDFRRLLFGRRRQQGQVLRSPRSRLSILRRISSPDGDDVRPDRVHVDVVAVDARGGER